jgi:CRP-like cAMP-binding protein
LGSLWISPIFSASPPPGQFLYIEVLDQSDTIYLIEKEAPMACDPELLKKVSLFSLLDDEETAVLAGQVELKTFAPRERIYRFGDQAPQASRRLGKVRVSMVDEDQQEVVVDEPASGDFFGFASMLEQTPHQTNAIALEETACVEVSRDDIAVLLARKPMAGMDMLTTLGRQFHAAQHMVRLRASRNPNRVIEQEATVGERIADSVARFGGSWTFINSFAIVLAIYTFINISLDKKAWDPYPFNCSTCSCHRGHPGAGDHESQIVRTRKTAARNDFEVNCRAESGIRGLAHGGSAG